MYYYVYMISFWNKKRIFVGTYVGCTKQTLVARTNNILNKPHSKKLKDIINKHKITVDDVGYTYKMFTSYEEARKYEQDLIMFNKHCLGDYCLNSNNS